MDRPYPYMGTCRNLRDPLPDDDEWDDEAAVKPEVGELLGRYIFGMRETESNEKIRPNIFGMKRRESRHQLQINREN